MAELLPSDDEVEEEDEEAGTTEKQEGPAAQGSANADVQAQG